MNENNYIQTIGENSTLQDSIIENMYLKAFAPSLMQKIHLKKNT